MRSSTPQSEIHARSDLSSASLSQSSGGKVGTGQRTANQGALIKIDK